MNVRSERESQMSFRRYVALCVLSGGCLFAQSSLRLTHGSTTERAKVVLF
jgi:hypothetical protein